MAGVLKSGTSGKSALKKKPPVTEKMYKLDCSNARYEPPAVNGPGQDVIEVDNDEKK